MPLRAPARPQIPHNSRRHRELPSHHNRASLISSEPLRELIQRHHHVPASKSVTEFSSSGGSRRRGVTNDRKAKHCAATAKPVLVGCDPTRHTAGRKILGLGSTFLSDRVCTPTSGLCSRSSRAPTLGYRQRGRSAGSASVGTRLLRTHDSTAREHGRPNWDWSAHHISAERAQL